ncbi:hypothetical protein CFIMG_008665RA00001 [Ceratocystis fimbriata CBS 114723]|uniref:Uncharacterized protein n=1 Tax=Ceratocystis fimbriata CBS 114723 TaxID=1035309 RepID=A0A2C5WMR2_9PEZI|nr:hypothetical protein CFIMG_008665RA00001 [Ceratocystis fimbriata CBS 114723]
MRLAHLVSLCLPFPWFNDYEPGSSDAVQSPDAITIASSSDSAHPADLYLEEHGYTVNYLSDDGVMVHSSRYNPYLPRPLLYLYINTKHKVTTIFDNNLDQEFGQDGKLELYEIFERLCARKDMKPENMKWVAMDVDNAKVNIDIRNYRRTRLLDPKARIAITPKDEDKWSAFSKNSFYQRASTMVPGANIDKIVINRQERQVRNIDGEPRLANVMMFSFKKPPPTDAPVVSSADAYADELAAEEDLKAALKDAKEASDATIKAALEASGEGCSGTSPGS